MSDQEGCDISTNQSQGCPVPVGNTICGEANSLEIMKEFNRLYEERMEQVDSEAGGDCLQEKVKLQQEWIRNLTQQNDMLVRAVQELEYEATERVRQLEDKLHKSAQCLCEVMKKYREHDFTVDLLAEPLQKISHLEDDVTNVLEFVRRVRESEEWSTDGLFFYNITKEDLLGTKSKYSNKLANDGANEGEKLLEEKERTVQELTQRVNYFNSFGDVEGMAKELQVRREECESLKQVMADSRQALTEEVALKHDEVIMLRKDLKVLEDRCLQADKQTAFKEDIIRELRKEIKLLKQQVTEKYLNLVADQLQTFFESHKNISDEKEIMSKTLSNVFERTGEFLDGDNEVVTLKKYIIIKDRLLQEQFDLIKTLVTKLFTVDQHLRRLEEQTTSCVADRELDSCKERIRKFEIENASLKETLLVEKTHIEELDEQFRAFLHERDMLKHRSKELEKKTKNLIKERETLNCECNVLKTEINRLKQENGKLQGDVKATKNQLEVFKAESASCQRKMQEMAEENRETIEQVFSLNEENRNLSQSIDALRHKSELSSIENQEEFSKLNATIEKLRTNLEKTRLTQEEDELVHKSELAKLNETIIHLEQGLKVYEEKYQMDSKGYKAELSKSNETIIHLEQELKVYEEKYQRDSKICKICRGKSKVGFLESTEVQANLDGKELELEKVINDIKTKMSVEIEKRNNKIQLLKNKVNELESALCTCEERAANLQEAVTLYSNSVNVLEAAKEDAKDQIDQQKMTIANLQQALVEAKQEIDEFRRKTQENDLKRQGIVKMLENVLQDTEEENELIAKRSVTLNQKYEKLQDLNFTLEVEHCDSLQDIDVLENRLNNYKGLFRENETQMKKLCKQKKCYEEIIAYFKHEMGLMADQLNNLQELLTLSNETSQQESSKIMNAFLEVQNVNQTLSSQLCASEQKVQLENQMNQLHEAKICELQCLIKEKEMDLTKHDHAILNIRKTLNDSLKQNEALQKTIVELNDTVNKLRNAINEYQHENCESKKSCMQFQEQIGSYCDKLQDLKRTLDEKTAESLKLEMAYNNEKRALKAAQKQLQETEKLQQENHKSLVDELEDLKRKLTLSEGNNGKLCQECEMLENQLSTLNRKEAVKDLEIKRYRKIVGDLKATMMDLNSELNKNLIQKELSGGTCNNSSCRKNKDKDDQSHEICLTCPCEIEFYQNMVDILKKSISDLKRKLSDTLQKNKELEGEMKQKDDQLCEVQNAKDKLYKKLQQSQVNDEKTAELEREIDQLRQELQVKSLQLNEVKRSAQEINGSKCVQLACAQDEISNLKNEIANILNRQQNLKRENEELQSQTTQLHYSISSLSDMNKKYKEQIDQYTARIRHLNTEKQTLLRKNKELLDELKNLQSMTSSADKQQRITTDSLKQLEADMEDLKSSNEEICLESKNVIKNVRAWVTEQKRINYLVTKREQEYMETIKNISYTESHSVNPEDNIPTKSPCGVNKWKDRNCHNLSMSPGSLGSQGTASYRDCESPCPDYGVNEWYSNTFRSESENDSEEDYCVNTLESLTQQIKKSNKIWIDEKKTCRGCKKCWESNGNQ